MSDHVEEEYLALEFNKWCWMMDYCKKNGLPPARSWAWFKASNAFEEHKEKQKARRCPCLRMQE